MWPPSRSVPAPRGKAGLAMSQRSEKLGGWGEDRNDGKRDFQKRCKFSPPTGTHNSRLFKDNQLRCKCSPELRAGQREPLFPWLHSTKCVCGEVSWWQLKAPNLYTSASHCFTYLLKRLIHAFIHPGSKMIHSSHTHWDTHMLQKHIWTPSRGWEVFTQSPFLLCWKAGKTLVRHGGFSAHVERLMGDYRSGAWARVEQGPSCWTGS